MSRFSTNNDPEAGASSEILGFHFKSKRRCCITGVAIICFMLETMTLNQAVENEFAQIYF
jgi:hypothetical protein